jgi:hypothetical protein
MTSLHYNPYSGRGTSYSVAPVSSYTSSYDSRPRMTNSSSVISGIKSMFCSKKAPPSISSVRLSSSTERSFSGIQVAGGSSRIVESLSIADSVPRREMVRIKTSDAFPVLSPHLEDRMLQLADRSRRLGVHRFSRTRNALILNQHTSSQSIAPAVSWCARPPSTSSLSTRSSLSGSIQKISLPELGHPSVRE